MRRAVKLHWVIKCFVDFWMDPRHFILGEMGSNSVLLFWHFHVVFLHAQLGVQINNICNGLFPFYVNCSGFVFDVAESYFFFLFLFSFFFFSSSVFLFFLSSRYV